MFQRTLFYILHFTLFIFISCQPQKENKQYASLSDSTHYVGINTCKQCHQDIYETFIKTGMGMSFDSASHAKSSARFSDHAVVYDKYKNLSYHPYWQGDSLYVKEYRLDGKDTSYERMERISYIVGSGQHTNSHMMNVNGYVYQVPATFYTQKGQWDLPPGFEDGHNSRFGRMIELECMTCHNGYPKIVEGSENKYEMIPNGIDCERCHGPGSEHVKQKMQGKLVDISKEIDYSIVNPAKLPIALQLDICQRCHIQGNAVLNEGKSFYDFKPGMHLSDVMNVYMPVYKGREEEHIMASHAERLKMSQCFLKSNANASDANSLKPYEHGLTCVTCHNPHVSVKVTGQDHFNNVCRNCHHDAHANDSKVLASVKDGKGASALNCVQCHMPKNGTVDIPHVSVTDHFIRKPVDTATVQRIKEFVTLACINNSNADNTSRGNAFISYFEKFNHNPAFLDSARRYFSDATDADVTKNLKSLVRIAYLRNDFKTVIAYAERVKDIFSTLNHKSYSNEDAWALYRVGESYHTLGNVPQAVTFFQHAADLEPYNLDFRNKLAQAQVEGNKIDDARKNFEFIISENPKYSSAYVSLGFLFLSVDHNIERANNFYDKALALDPDNEQAMFNKAGALYYLNRRSDAVAMLQRLLKKNPQRDDAKQMLMMLKKA